MAIQPRFILPGYPQHVIQRGNNPQIIFADGADYRFYRQKLTEACARFSCRVHAWVLMSNHVHLLITPDIEAGIGKVMQSVGRCYVQYFNYRCRRTGTLWEGRYTPRCLTRSGIC
jgi:putative transposase